MGKPKIGMRDAFFNALYEIARNDRDVYIVSADNGAPTIDQFASNLRDQFIQVGIAEQQMIGMAAGLALEGKKVYTYAICPFITARVYEQIKIDVCAQNLQVTMLGVGAGYAYDIMGPTHHTVEDFAILRVQPNMTILSPADGTTAAAMAPWTHRNAGPCYVRFDRAGLPEIYETAPDLETGFAVLREGTDCTIVATGVMVGQALSAAEELARNGVSAGVLDLFRIKPLDADRLLAALGPATNVVTLEEHYAAGGIGGMLAELFTEREVPRRLLRLGQADRFAFEMGGRAAIWE
ncbi:MAG: 1-deoxy-D-xylulose-5-phosphate synthase, partial [Acidobacteria bacterium]